MHVHDRRDVELSREVRLKLGTKPTMASTMHQAPMPTKKWCEAPVPREAENAARGPGIGPVSRAGMVAAVSRLSACIGTSPVRLNARENATIGAQTRPEERLCFPA
jgi:hypothetical protein